MKKLIVISADALVAEDMEYLETLPNFKKYLAGGVGVRKVHSVYPTDYISVSYDDDYRCLSGYA